MKNSTTFAILLVCLTFVACKKNSTTEDTKPKIKLLNKIGKVSSGGTDTTFTYISYDNKNRISEMRTGSSTKVYNYTGNNLASITMKNASGVITSTLFTFTYNGDVIASGIAPNDNPLITATYAYTVANGLVVKRTSASTPYSHEFTYSGNNLASYKLIGSGTVNLQYGTDKNPFYNARYRYLLTLPIEADDIFSENNLISSISQTTPYVRGVWYSYLVGNDGFPKSVTVKTTSALDPDIFVYTVISYTYEMRDVAN